MFVRQKPNKSGVISIQIISKGRGKYEVIETIGSSSDPQRVEQLFQQAKDRIAELGQQSSFNFDIEKERALSDMFFTGLNEIRLMGPELLLGKLFDEIGYKTIHSKLFRSLVITRLVYPVSKLKTTDYWFKFNGTIIDVERIYRYMDKLNSKHKETIQQISYNHTLQILNNQINMVFYDVTTLYFEIEEPDQLRKTGFSKDGKHQHPQIVLGLLVSQDGYPLAYEIFEGNKYEGHTLMPVLESFRKKYNLKKLVVIADAGLLSHDNVEELCTKSYGYILGARIKNESQPIKEKILALKLKNGESTVLNDREHSHLIISYSDARARKDAATRKKGLEKLERNVASGKLTKQNINNRGYNKYLKMDGKVSITIDYEKYKDDSKWDGLKGYLTNTDMSKDEVINHYGQLWKIEKAFRISKTDLRIRPIYHRLQRRIEAHICIAFCAYKIYKELERLLEEKKAGLSPEKTIDILKTIYKVTITLPYSKTKESRLFLPNQEQRTLLELFQIN
jgi:transposase